MIRTGFLVLALAAVFASVATDLSTSGPMEWDPGVRTLDESSAPTADVLPRPPRDPNSGITLTDMFGTMTLASWNSPEGEWEAGGGAMLETARSNDGAVPLVLRIDGATPGATYEITLTYGGCEANGAAGFDSVSGVDPSWELPRSAPPGPASARPDSTVPAPGPHDGGGPNTPFELWGATFQDSRDGPFEAAGCDGPRSVTLTVLAQAERLFLMWAGHVRPAETAACLAITTKVDLIGSQTLSAVDCAEAGSD